MSVASNSETRSSQPTEALNVETQHEQGELVSTILVVKPQRLVVLVIKIFLENSSVLPLAKLHSCFEAGIGMVTFFAKTPVQLDPCLDILDIWCTIIPLR